MPTDPPAPPAAEELWRLLPGLRFLNGRLQQRWLCCRNGRWEWRDVPEVWGEDA